MKDGKFITLGIETSCDETSIAVTAEGREVLSDIISSQIAVHTKFGGVVPEIASRHHLQNINGVLDQALSEAGVSLADVDLIGVTNGPGLIGAVVIGVATAKALSLAAGIPLVGVNHMHGHVSASYLQYPELEPPFLALIVSGGHTNIVEVTDYNRCTVLGGTRDDAVGEAYDKVARVVGLGYPGGPKVDRAAKDGDPDAIRFKRVYLENGSLDFSFSGLKTQVLNYINRERMAGREVNVADLSASFQQAMLDVLVDKTMLAAEQTRADRLVTAGGVAANSRLRQMLAEACGARGIRLYMPEPVLCTDNGAMIAAAAYYKYRMQGPDDLSLDAYANLPL
ncbi:tRNA (adenosine(37)-N6)-threonylcarbamoyltransferase complex transferase subunit TsaD [Hornefia butyriciproducens]|uniref:tRNA N6-adenosine threonylcarbamoyltransferase n=1 Tax=Hornefia butyriciproducens TaxID=2652293 RepID=A0A6L5Y8G5_9FIRM|nr:tRNA (adenosine(37)-N6)-threonylcarbamoyltransferase complex transferase subunit TsaD [Hornefia butyriciproducens]MCI7413086.1 tRNA (adenosine(37)-N6)-threonylcarbamoyltransferase complex transferase subunit TsaD [Clostridiales bacterium]MDY6212788.1 tRNA (adenosine(37)-N6)-threonylcarbamoyltransferase complex transferase subunit TsaD [Hornefia butyriciproducens]MST52282.1 tRNA (adenosine(37)-N6)-threonylcarbamoyltransferase complex transferase subunit TsaD [Hornefia butyriciproducens]